MVRYLRKQASLTGASNPPNSPTFGGSEASTSALKLPYRPLDKSRNLTPDTIKAFFDLGHTEIQQSVRFLCFNCADYSSYEELQQRHDADWFPHFPTDIEYWCSLSKRACKSWGFSPSELKDQSMLLLLKVRQHALNAQDRRHELSQEFSPLQNLYLLALTFRLRPLRYPISADMLLFGLLFEDRVSSEARRTECLSELFKEDPASIRDKRVELGRTLLISPLAPTVCGHYSLLGILDDIPTWESQAVCVQSSAYRRDFPSFLQERCQLPLFLVVSESLSRGDVSRHSRKLLYRWTASSDGVRAFRSLLKSFEDVISPEELILIVTALTAFGQIAGFKNTPHSGPYCMQLECVLRHIDSHKDNETLLQEMFWSLYTLVEASPQLSSRGLKLLQATSDTAGQQRVPDCHLSLYFRHRLEPYQDHTTALQKVLMLP